MNFKSKKGISLVVLIFLIVLILVITTIITGLVIINKNKNKESITANEFKNKMEDMNYIVVDAKDQFEEYDYIEKVYLAAPKNYKYQIEFYEMDEEEQAISFYNNNQEIFESYNSSASAETNVSIGNNAKYTLTTEDEYRLLSRIDNTVIYVHVDKEYKDEIKEVLKELGY